MPPKATIHWHFSYLEVTRTKSHYEIEPNNISINLVEVVLRGCHCWCKWPRRLQNVDGERMCIGIEGRAIEPTPPWEELMR